MFIFLSKSTVAGANFSAMCILQTTKAMLQAGVRSTRLIAASFTEAEAILHKIRAGQLDLTEMRLSARRAIEFFGSFSILSGLHGSLGSAKLDFGHNTFERGSCANGIDPKETLCVLLCSGALAPVSAVFILCADTYTRCFFLAFTFLCNTCMRHFYLMVSPTYCYRCHSM